MKTGRFVAMLSLAAVALLCTSCDDSKTPLSQPQQSKTDPGLIGTWRLKDSNNVTYYHVGRVEGQLPESVLRLVSVTFSKAGNLTTSANMLLFPTQLGGQTYVNLAGVDDAEKLQDLISNGWNPDDISGYWLNLYRLDNNTLTVYPIDGAAKKQAIESGKIKGEILKQENGETVRFTDTSENLARFVSAAGASLFAKTPLRLERVK